DASDGYSVLIADLDEIVIELEGFGRRWFGALRDPCVEAPESGAGHDAVRSVVHIGLAFGEIGDGTEHVSVDVGGAGDLPGADEIGVVLAGFGEAQDTLDIGFALEHEHRHGQVGADANRFTVSYRTGDISVAVLAG